VCGISIRSGRESGSGRLTAEARRRKAALTIFRIMHTGAYGSSVRSASKKKQPRRSRRVDADQFRTARRFSGLSRADAAEFLGVSLRTIGHWETGRARPSFAAFKLLRIYRHGDLIDPNWTGYSIIRGKLVTPENHTFEPHELSWLSLLVRRARAFSELLAQRDGKPREASAPRAAAPAPGVACDVDLIGLHALRPCEAGVAAHSKALFGDSPRLIGESVKLNGKVSASVGVFAVEAPAWRWAPFGVSVGGSGIASVGGAL